MSSRTKKLAVGLSKFTSGETLVVYFQNPLYRNSFFLFINTAFGALFGFLFWYVVARLFSPDAVGVATAAISAATLLAGIAGLGLGLAVIRFISTTSEDEGNTLINGVLIIGAGTALLLGSIYLVSVPFWSSELTFLAHSPLWSSLFVLGVCAWTIAPITDQILLSHRSGVSVFKRNLTMHALKVTLPLTLAAVGGGLVIFGSFVLAVAVSVVVALFLMKTKLRPSYRFRFNISSVILRRDMLRFALGNHLGDYLQYAPIHIIPLIVIGKFGEAQTALYYVSFMIASMLYSVTGALATSAFVEDSSSSVAEGYDSLLKAAKTSVVVLIPGALCLYFVGPHVLALFGQAYTEATGLLRAFTFAAPLHAAVTLLVAYWRVKKDTSTMTIFGLLVSTGIILAVRAAPTLTSIGYSYMLGLVPGILFGFISIIFNLYRIRRKTCR